MTERLPARRLSAPLVGLGVAVGAFFVYWLTNQSFEAGRGDFFYLADAFLHGRVSLDVRLGYQDVIVRGSQLYLPFAPFPAFALIRL